MDLGWFEVALNVADVKRSLEFYRKLGFELSGDVVEQSGASHAALYRDDCSITLYQGHLDPARPQLNFWQGDVNAIAADLTANGVEFFRPLKTDDEGGGAFMLLDPDGHPVFIIAMMKYDSNSPATGADGKRAKARQYPPNAKREIDFGWFEISLPVKKMGASVDFYQKLGFRIAEEDEPGNVTLVSNDCRLSLYEGDLDPDRLQLIFWQGNVPAIAAHLSAKGVSFLKPPTSGAKGTGAMLIDPDGHPVYFVNIDGLTRKEPA